jgi:hypothetical protein
MECAQSSHSADPEHNAPFFVTLLHSVICLAGFLVRSIAPWFSSLVILALPISHLTNLPKSSPNGFINGQMSPFFSQNGLHLSPSHHQQEEEFPLSLVSHNKTPRPLQEIGNANITNEENHGAIDLTKKPAKHITECSNVTKNGAIIELLHTAIL